MEQSRFQWNNEKMIDFQDFETRKKRKRLIASTCCAWPRSLFFVLCTLYLVRPVVSADKDPKSGLIRQMAKGSPIWGVAVLDGELYVVRDSTEFIEVHDIPTGKMVRTLPVKGLSNPFDMVSSDRCKCVFVSDWKSKSVFKVDKNGDVIQWQESNMPFGLSVNSAGNLLVTFTSINMIAEYTPSGDLVRKVKVSHKVVGPWYAVEKPDDGGFFVSCMHMKRSEESRCSRYTIITVDSHGEPAVKKVAIRHDETMECPTEVDVVTAVQLAVVDNSRSVVVSDLYYGSLPILSKSTNQVKLLVLWRSEVSRLFRVCFDDESGLTFLAEYKTDEEGQTIGYVKVRRLNLSTEATSSDDKHYASGEL